MHADRPMQSLLKYVYSIIIIHVQHPGIVYTSDQPGVALL